MKVVESSSFPLYCSTVAVNALHRCSPLYLLVNFSISISSRYWQIVHCHALACGIVCYRGLGHGTQLGAPVCTCS